MQFVFLGCGDGHGVPRVGCRCQVCHNALAPDSRNGRTGPSAALRGGPSYADRVVLIDAPLEFRLQAVRLGLDHFDALLLTHAHDAHILGLSALVQAQREAGLPLPIYAPAQVLDQVRERFNHFWTDKVYRRVVQPRPIEQGVDLWGLEVRALRLDHGLGGTAYGYLFSFGRGRLAYISDMLRPTAEVRQALTGLDLLVLGTSHYYEEIDLWKRSVMDIVAALDLIRQVAPRQALLTHLSHTVDYEAISARLPPGIGLAYDGLSVEVEE